MGNPPSLDIETAWLPPVSEPATLPRPIVSGSPAPGGKFTTTGEGKEGNVNTSSCLPPLRLSVSSHSSDLIKKEYSVQAHCVDFFQEARSSTGEVSRLGVAVKGGDLSIGFKMTPLASRHPSLFGNFPRWLSFLGFSGRVGPSLFNIRSTVDRPDGAQDKSQVWSLAIGISLVATLIELSPCDYFSVKIGWEANAYLPLTQFGYEGSLGLFSSFSTGPNVAVRVSDFW